MTLGKATINKTTLSITIFNKMTLARSILLNTR